jgi:hypothetical protein
MNGIGRREFLVGTAATLAAGGAAATLGAGAPATCRSAT